MSIDRVIALRARIAQLTDQIDEIPNEGPARALVEEREKLMDELEDVAILRPRQLDSE